MTAPDEPPSFDEQLDAACAAYPRARREQIRLACLIAARLHPDLSPFHLVTRVPYRGVNVPGGVVYPKITHAEGYEPLWTVYFGAACAALEGAGT